MRCLSRNRSARRPLSELVAEPQSETAPRNAICKMACIGTRAVSGAFLSISLLKHEGPTTDVFVYTIVENERILLTLSVI